MFVPGRSTGHSKLLGAMHTFNQRKLRLLLGIFFCCFLGSWHLSGQERVGKNYYVEIFESAPTAAKAVYIDFGKDTPGRVVYKIFDEHDNNLDFKNIVAAINYLSGKGWELVSVYNRDMNKLGLKTVYLLKLDTGKFPKDHIAEVIEKTLAEQ